VTLAGVEQLLLSLDLILVTANSIRPLAQAGIALHAGGWGLAAGEISNVSVGIYKRAPAGRERGESDSRWIGLPC
jgi:hypothetical protein